MKASERAVILPVTIGSMLEWYEIFLYIYWAPIIAENFFDLSGPVAELINAIFVLIIGFVSRPLGGLLFGYIGDRWGRKNSFLLSIVLISIPSFGAAFMPSYVSWSHFALIYIGIMKFIQGIPAGGELPGAMCLLAEGGSPERKRYLCSYTFVGPQAGQVLSMTQCLLMEKFLPQEFLVQWGWRISFFIGGVAGIFGYFLRKKMHESRPFQHLKESARLTHNPIKETFKNHKKNVFLGFVISIFEVASFFLVAFFLVENSGKIFNLSVNQNLLVNIILLIPLTIIQPFIGKIGDKYKNKPMFMLSAIGTILISLPFYLAITNSSKLWSLVILGLLVALLSIQFALLPSLIAELYPTSIRFTCIGFSFNVCDSVIGGITPMLAILLTQVTANPAAFVAIFPISALIFLCALPFIKSDGEYSLS